MTMLPTPTPAVVAVLSGHGDDSHAHAAVEALVGREPYVLVTGLMEGLICCDAAVAVIDANAGVDPSFVERWSRLAESHVPRVAVAENSVGGRVEFAEIAAILERTTGDDIASRYLPLADDEETHAAGVLDVLSGEVVTATGESRTADAEHVTLTSDESELLIDVLAHAVLSDVLLESYLAGAPVSLPALRSGYAAACASGDNLVALLPAEPSLGGAPLRAILGAVTRSWVAVVDSPLGSVDAPAADACVGIGIDSGVARVWNCTEPCDCELVADGAPVGKIRVTGAIVRDPAIRAGSTLRPDGSSLVVRAPRF